MVLLTMMLGWLQAAPLSPLADEDLTVLVSGTSLEWRPGPVSGAEYFYPGGVYLSADRTQVWGRWWADEGHLCSRYDLEGAETRCLLVVRDSRGHFYAAQSPEELSEGRMAEIRFVTIDNRN